ncbi:MAG: hypothetical protein IPH68_06510 [Chitinophagaceae bacterium]|nr:hypothetical protein [Chitinophagaceae bacterium]MBK7122485.1 hypothetical protein [Chitinophagaceae bacterium]MBK9530881.1 hypothetical protein [Chitinophagaceae bacterium]
MKKLKTLFIMILLTWLALPVFAQEAKWIEMENFHAVMSITFHPAEEDNLEPVKKNAAELLSRAKAWQKADAPAGYNGTATQPVLKQLVKQCKLINAAVKKNNKSDAELKIMITRAHDIFHEIKEKCRK